MTTKEQRDEWRKLKGQGMTSAVGEYTPSEFWELLSDVDRLERENKHLSDMLRQAEVELESARS